MTEIGGKIMRLIDADTLIKDLSYLYTKNRIPVDMRAKEILSTIIEQPTVYDVDKVVKQLEEYGTCKDKCSNRSCCYSCKDVVIDRSDAIDIVEAGGKNDD